MTRHTAPKRDDTVDYGRRKSQSSTDDDTIIDHKKTSSPTTDNKKKRHRKKRSGHKRHHYDLCLPPQGKTYLTIGQDLYSIQEYLMEQQNASLHWYMNRMADHGSNSKNVVVESDDDDDDDSSITTTIASTINTTTYKKPNKYQLRMMPVPRRDDVVPAAVMVYTDIQTLKGLDRPADYGSGIEYADGALELASPAHGSSNPNPLGVGLQIGLWLNGTEGCRDIVSGKLDRKINQLVYYLGYKCHAEKVFLRIGYEFDNPSFGYAKDPEIYKQAFQYIVEKCRKHNSCRQRVLMVWHSWAAGVPNGKTLNDFYPGDDLVDWIGISVFQQFYPHTTTGNFAGGTVHDLEDVLNFALDHRKPTMIAESTPFGGIVNNRFVKTARSSSHNNKTGAATATTSAATTTTMNSSGSDTSIPSLNENPIWQAWFEPTLRLIKTHDIAMWSYINCNWDVQPIWQGIGFGDTRLSIDNNIMDQWHDFVIGNRRFIRATDYELCGNSAYETDYINDDDDDDDDDYVHYNAGKTSSQGKYHKHHHDYRYDDDDYFERHSEREIDDHKKESKGWWLWGEERSERREGLWNAILPLVMLSSALAIILFMYATSKRNRSKRLQRTPRAQRVRFAQLDDKADEDDESTFIYGSIRSIDDSEKSRVHRVGPNLVVANTGTNGATIIA